MILCSSGPCDLVVDKFVSDGAACLIFSFRTPSSPEEFQARTDFVDKDATEDWHRAIREEKPALLPVIFVRYKGVTESGRLVDRQIDHGFSHGTIRFRMEKERYLCSVTLDTYSLVALVCTALWGVNEHDFLALAMLSRLAEGSFHKCGMELVRRLDLIHLGDQLLSAKVKAATGPRLPVKSAELLTRMLDPFAYVWYAELKQMIGVEKDSTLKKHLIACGLAARAVTMDEWKCTAWDIRTQFAPYLRTLKPVHQMFLDFLDALEGARLISRSTEEMKGKQ